MKRPSPLAAVAVIGVIALLGLLAYGLTTNSPDRSIDSALADGERIPAPALELERLTGDGDGSLSDYRGKLVVLNVWASWCEPCRRESPLLQRWHERIARGGRGTVLGIDVHDVSSDARAFADRYGLTYPMLRDPDAAQLQPYGVVAYPETFVIDGRGRIVAARRGEVDERFMRTEVGARLEKS